MNPQLVENAITRACSLLCDELLNRSEEIAAAIESANQDNTHLDNETETEDKKTYKINAAINLESTDSDSIELKVVAHGTLGKWTSKSGTTSVNANQMQLPLDDDGETESGIKPIAPFAGAKAKKGKAV